MFAAFLSRRGSPYGLRPPGLPRRKRKADNSCAIKTGHFYLLLTQEERTVGRDNCVRYQRKILQIPADQHRCHYVKARVRVHEYPNGHYAVFHGPRRLADYDSQGQIIGKVEKQAAA